jgi:aminomethyltransferase
MNAELGKPQKTSLYPIHEEFGARMVEFAGYAMPLSYPSGIVREHLWTRESAGLFDVSHMGQLRVSGRHAAAALESLIPLDIAGLQRGRQRYGVLTNDAGGILDDLMVANLGDAWLLVVNAARKQADIRHLQSCLDASVSIELLEDRSLIALQGPAAAAVLARLAPETAAMAFMEVREIAVCGSDCIVSRSGYTGEDGFELSVPDDAALRVAGELLRQREVAPVGLGARDSLRLEAGLCLYGHDLDETTTPIEAGLAFTVSPARRAGGARAGGFPGADVVLQQLAGTVARTRVCLLPKSRVPVREGTEVFDGSGRAVGTVTSGSFGPTLGAPVSMGYVETESARPGNVLSANVRDKNITISVAENPAVPHRYLRQA